MSQAEAVPLLRGYWSDIAGSYHGRPVTSAEIDEILLAEPSDDMLMLVARLDGEPVGCLGLRFHVPLFAEVKRVYVVAAARGRGVGQALLAEAERVARNHDAVTMRLAVREDLVEARSLYAKCGYTEVEPFNDEDYVDRWLAKDLLYSTVVSPDDVRLKSLLASLNQELRDRYENIGVSPILPETRFVLALRGQTPVGCVSVQPKGPDFELKRMFVTPSARGSGVAPLLLDAADAMVLAAGGRRIVLETGVRQPEAIRLYEKSGYTRISGQDPSTVSFAKVLAEA